MARRVTRSRPTLVSERGATRWRSTELERRKGRRWTSKHGELQHPAAATAATELRLADGPHRKRPLGVTSRRPSPCGRPSRSSRQLSVSSGCPTGRARGSSVPRRAPFRERSWRSFTDRAVERFQPWRRRVRVALRERRQSRSAGRVLRPEQHRSASPLPLPQREVPGSWRRRYSAAPPSRIL